MIGHPELSAYLEWVHTVARGLLYCHDEFHYTPGMGWEWEDIGHIDRAVMSLARQIVPTILPEPGHEHKWQEYKEWYQLTRESSISSPSQ